MDSAMRKVPRGRPLEANNIDHIIRCYDGETIAIEMEPHQMQKSKQPKDMVQYIDFLNRRNGELRFELTFYRECYRHAEKFKEKIDRISQDLLQACILGLLDGVAFDEIRDLSNAVSDAVDQLSLDQEQAFDAFIAPYKASKSQKKLPCRWMGGFEIHFYLSTFDPAALDGQRMSSLTVPSQLKWLEI